MAGPQRFHCILSIVSISDSTARTSASAMTLCVQLPDQVRELAHSYNCGRDQTACPPPPPPRQGSRNYQRPSLTRRRAFYGQRASDKLIARVSEAYHDAVRCRGVSSRPHLCVSRLCRCPLDAARLAGGGMVVCQLFPAAMRAALGLGMTARRFPPPWSIEESGDGSPIRDCHAQDCVFVTFFMVVRC